MKYVPIKNDPTKAQEKIALLKEMNTYLDHAISYSEGYKQHFVPIFVYAFVPVYKTQIARENVLSKAENEQLVNESKKIVDNLFVNSKNQQIFYWLRSLSKVAPAYVQFEYLATQDSIFAKYFKDATSK